MIDQSKNKCWKSHLTNIGKSNLIFVKVLHPVKMEKIWCLIYFCFYIDIKYYINIIISMMNWHYPDLRANWNRSDKENSQYFESFKIESHLLLILIRILIYTHLCIWNILFFPFLLFYPYFLILNIFLYGIKEPGNIFILFSFAL